MTRMARVEAIGYPHHVIQRGNRKQNVFIKETDKEKYLKILDLQSKLFGLKIWAYCLMDNHVHLIVVPEKQGSLTRTISETHRLYTRMVNFREKWRGYLWQGRFKSYPLDEKYLYAAVRYVECNPVRAKLVIKAEDYKWSSARWHIENSEGGILARFYLQDQIKNWSGYLAEREEEASLEQLRTHMETGRPLGEDEFLDLLEDNLGRVFKKLKPGPKNK